MMSVEDEMRLIYENRLKRQLKEGFEKGIEKGIEQGELSKATEIAKTMKANGYPAGEISKITGLQVEEIEKL